MHPHRMPPIYDPNFVEALVRDSPRFIAVLDLDGNPEYFNSTAINLLGHAGNEANGGKAAELFMPKDLEFFRNEVLPKVLKHGAWQGPLAFRHGKTGVSQAAQYQLFRNDDPATGHPVNIAMVNRSTDNGDAKSVALFDAEKRMASVLAATEVGTWTYEIKANRVVADANLSRMFGVSPDDAAGGQLSSYLFAIHSEDRPRVEEIIAKCIEDGSLFQSEYRLVQKDGEIRHVIARGKVERDSAGEAVNLPGVILDITARVRAWRFTKPFQP